ncbi:hypothetical protein HK097_006070, partial [Rhizophlyctis rosea]
PTEHMLIGVRYMPGVGVEEVEDVAKNGVELEEGLRMPSSAEARLEVESSEDEGASLTVEVASKAEIVQTAKENGGKDDSVEASSPKEQDTTPDIKTQDEIPPPEPLSQPPPPLSRAPSRLQRASSNLQPTTDQPLPRTPSHLPKTSPPPPLSRAPSTLPSTDAEQPLEPPTSTPRPASSRGATMRKTISFADQAPLPVSDSAEDNEGEGEGGVENGGEEAMIMSEEIHPAVPSLPPAHITESSDVETEDPPSVPEADRVSPPALSDEITYSTPPSHKVVAKGSLIIHFSNGLTQSFPIVVEEAI